jgi:hypothetical protein
VAGHYKGRSPCKPAHGEANRIGIENRKACPVMPDNVYPMGPFIELEAYS